MAILRSSRFIQAGFAHGFPESGTSDRDLAAALGAGAIVVTAKQVHGACAVDAAEATSVEADAICARAEEGHVAIGVRVADCVPILVADEASGDVAVIHAGWRGVVAGVVPAALERLRAREVIAAIGPCIGACCFEVGIEVAESIAQVSFGAAVIVERRGEKAYADLRAAVRAQLRFHVGSDARIDDVPGCTKHEPGRFHSFRRDGANSGRMLAAIATRPRA